MEREKYDDIDRCPKCGNFHEVKPVDLSSDFICEANTKCTCGHVDFWAFGFYESKWSSK